MPYIRMRANICVDNMRGHVDLQIANRPADLFGRTGLLDHFNRHQGDATAKLSVGDLIEKMIHAAEEAAGRYARRAPVPKS
jgi:hypothetical protein